MDLTAMTEEELKQLHSSNYEQLRNLQHANEAIAKELARREQIQREEAWTAVKNAVEEYLEVGGIEVSTIKYQRHG